MLAMIKQTNACKIVSNNILLYYIYCFKMMLFYRMVAFLVLSIISAFMGSNMVFLGATIINVISALGGFSGGFNTWAVLFCLVFAIGVVQTVSACVAAGFGCSVVCCNTNTVEVVEITPSRPMTSIGQIA